MVYDIEELYIYIAMFNLLGYRLRRQPNLKSAFIKVNDSCFLGKL